MNQTFMGLEISLKHSSSLDPGFLPLAKVFAAYEQKTGGGDAAGIAVERPGGRDVFRFNMENSLSPTELDKYMAWLLIKSVLWICGGKKLFIAGSPALAEYIRGLKALDFDRDMMETIYEGPLEVISVSLDELPAGDSSGAAKAGQSLKGCRLGFDAGGSDIKVSAVVDGEAIFSQEIIWHPKITADPAYHYEHILDAMKLAAEKMPRVDSIGVSSAGVYVNNRTMVASLFMQVPKAQFDSHVRDIYPRAAAAIGPVPLTVANDGDVTALAGAMELGEGRVLGIAMGTSEAGGYIDKNMSITGWLNELAFAPVDGNPLACLDEWSGAPGTGVKYFSQDAVIKLAPAAGIDLDPNLSPAEKLKAVQKLMAEKDPRAWEIFAAIGMYLGYTLAYYSRFYDIGHLLLMGRVLSEEGGALIVEKARAVLKDEYPALNESIKIHLPDEKSRRVGQSVAAASLESSQ